MSEKYNGWTNYATWRVNLEIFDKMTLDDFGIEYDEEDNNMIDTSDFADTLKNYVEEHIEETSEGIAKDYALAFVSDVNWYELAEHMIEEAKEAAQ